MSKDITVLAPNGRRQKVHCSPDTCILQILEDVCQKQGFDSNNYILKHHNRVLDLTTTIRFSNIPNKATLDMIVTEEKREESIVTIALLLEDGDRKTGDYIPNTTLYDIVVSLAPIGISTMENPTILYMRQEVTGVSALQQKTLRQLGLIKGKAILRLFNKAEEPKQANVSAVYRVPFSEKTIKDSSNTINNLVKDNKNNQDLSKKDSQINMKTESLETINNKCNSLKSQTDVIENKQRQKSEVPMKASRSSSMTQEELERRLKIEEQVNFIGAQKAIVFTPPDKLDDSVEDLPDDFYELTVEDVRRLYNDLKKQRAELEEMPLLTSVKKDELEKQNFAKTLNTYKNVVVRIQFPDNIILQGVFLPTNTIEDIIDFVKEHLQDPSKQFNVFTTPLKEKLDLRTSLLEAKYVPCVHMHFRWLEEKNGPPYLKEELYSKQTCSEAAQILASKYRAPSRKKKDDICESQPGTSTTKNSRAPKWFKK